jgi:hypothetical protein
VLGGDEGVESAQLNSSAPERDLNRVVRASLLLSAIQEIATNLAAAPHREIVARN